MACWETRKLKLQQFAPLSQVMTGYKVQAGISFDQTIPLRDQIDYSLLSGNILFPMAPTKIRQATLLLSALVSVYLGCTCQNH